MSFVEFGVFESIDIRVGSIVEVSEFPEARKPSYKLKIDFGKELGIKKSSAQITRHYEQNSLIGKQVIAVVNFKPRQIGPFMSEVLVLGVPDEQNEVVLMSPDKSVENGGQLF